jgi:hypothetical protein
MSTNEIAECAFMTMDSKTKTTNIHKQCGLAMDMIIKNSLARKSLDNITGVLIAFQNFENLFEAQEKPTKLTPGNSLRQSFEQISKIKNEEQLKSFYSRKPSLSFNKDNSSIKTHKRNFNSNDFKVEKDLKIRSFDNLLNVSDIKTKNNPTFASEPEFKKNYRKNIVINLQLSEKKKCEAESKLDSETQRNTQSCRSVNRSFLKLN